MLAFRKCRRSDNSEEQPAITARKQRKWSRTTIKRSLYGRRARAIRSPTPLRGSVCILASCSQIAYDCGNSAVLPACRELSEHICSPNRRAEDALESALACIVAAYEPLPTSRGLARDKVNTYVHPVTSAEFKRWLERQGASFEPAKGGHIWVFLRGRRAILPPQRDETRHCRSDKKAARLRVRLECVLTPQL